jgi:phosphoserine phosphatase
MTNLTLILSSPHLDKLDLAPLYDWIKSDKVVKPSRTVTKFLSAVPKKSSALSKWANAHQVDMVWVKSNIHFTDFGLIVCDMDSTFIAIECIDEIAKRLGLKEKVAAITKEAMAGNIDFSKALHQRVALLAGLPDSELEIVYQECVQLTLGAEALVRFAHQAGLRFVLLSGGFTDFAKRLQQEYALDDIYANQLEKISGRLTGKIMLPIIDAKAKADLLVKIGQTYQLLPEQIIAIGDGANDIPMLQKAGAGIAFHAKPAVIKAADYALQYSGLDTVRWLFQ